MEKITVFWFRRDLRLNDNRGLHHALKHSQFVLCLFIYDTAILDSLALKDDPRLSFITGQIGNLKHQLEKNGSSLIIRYGKPREIFAKLIEKYGIDAVFTNADYEPYARQRDGEVAGLLRQKNVAFHAFKDQVIFEKSEVIKGDGHPYTVFTPYMRKWRQRLAEEDTGNLASEKLLYNTLRMPPQPAADLSRIGFKYRKVKVPPSDPGDELIRNYDRTRDYPALGGTSRLGIHLRFGTVSIRRWVKKALQLNDTFLNELIWREFYMMILWHFPEVTTKSFKPAYDNIRWINNEQHFEAWREGRTGYPIVDAGMRQLKQTGYMHNRLRMITAGFLTKHLLTDWRWGEAWFAEQLLDFELSSNNGGWQWAAGSGCDSAPYFRIFNPELQTRKFDPDFSFIKTWIPEWNTRDYPEPIVEHKEARQRALTAYKSALDQRGSGVEH